MKREMDSSMEGRGKGIPVWSMLFLVANLPKATVQDLSIFWEHQVSDTAG